MAAPAPADPTPAPFRLAPLLAVVALALLAALAPLPLEPPAHRTLVVLVIAAGLWVTEALPVAVVALLIPPLGLVLGATELRAAFSGYGDPVLFLFLGAFLITEAAAVHGLHLRLAHAVLDAPAVRARPGLLLWAIALVGFVLSAWMNNTATTALLLPLALTAERLGAPRFTTAVLLMTAWAPTLGGLSTPVGTAPNLIGLRLIEQETGHRPSFAGWTATFAPLALLTLGAAGLWLRAVARGDAEPPPRAAHERLPDPGPWSPAERRLVPVAALVVVLWVLPGMLAATPLAQAAWFKAWQARVPEAVVPLLGGLALFLLPAGTRDGARLLDARIFRRLDWSTLLLLGGGLSLGAMMFESGLARALGEGLFALLPEPGLFGIVLMATIMAVVISELTSNTASVALVVPVVLALAQAAGVDPVRPAIAATVGCSFGFMLPVSTPPNALVFGTGRVPLRTMVVTGIVLDLVGVLLVSVWVTFLG
jgi:sodium-dependent dicarboxylate transporter 2/3/5